MHRKDRRTNNLGSVPLVVPRNQDCRLMTVARIWALAISLLPVAVRAEVKPMSLFSDNTVLHRSASLPWV
jgi:hypothetical protein